MKLSTSWAMALLKYLCIALQMCKSNYYVMYYIEKSTNVKNLKYHSPSILQHSLPLKNTGLQL